MKSSQHICRTGWASLRCKFHHHHSTTWKNRAAATQHRGHIRIYSTCLRIKCDQTQLSLNSMKTGRARRSQRTHLAAHRRWTVAAVVTRARAAHIAKLDATADRIVKWAGILLSTCHLARLFLRWRWWRWWDWWWRWRQWRRFCATGGVAAFADTWRAWRLRNATLVGTHLKPDIATLAPRRPP